MGNWKEGLTEKTREKDLEAKGGAQSRKRVGRRDGTGVSSVPILETEAQKLEPHWHGLPLVPFYESISTMEKDGRIERIESLKDNRILLVIFFNIHFFFPFWLLIPTQNYMS